MRRRDRCGGGRARPLAAEHVAAEAEDLMPVSVDDEADVGRDLVLDALDLRAGELEDLAAGLADEVVVVLALVLALEARLALRARAPWARPAACRSLSVR